MIYFIRHGQSVYNLAQEHIKEQYGPNYLSTDAYLQEKFDPKYFDVPLTPKGKEQAQKARDEVKDIHFDLIIVSPMRRALQTCQIIFHQHQSKAPILVVAAFRQILESSNDIGAHLNHSIKEYNFDFSLITDVEAWYVPTIVDEKVKIRIEQSIKGLKDADRNKKATELTLDFMKENWAARKAHLAEEQTEKIKVLPPYALQRSLLVEYLKSCKTVAVVAHSECIKQYAGYKIKNCEVFPFKADQLL